MTTGETILYKSFIISDLKEPYSVNIPFVCQKCGRCCQYGYQARRLPSEALRHLGYEDSEVGRRKFIQDYLGEIDDEDNFTPYKPCGLLKDNQCIIYPFRPDGCRHYPLLTDFGVDRDRFTGKPKCPAYLRLEEIERMLLRSYKRYAGWNMAYPDEEIRLKHATSDAQWRRVLKKFLSMKPSKRELELFCILNKRE